MNYRGKSTRTTPLLWEFFLSLLHDEDCEGIIKWIDKSRGAFRIVNSYQVATLWGDLKGRPKMNENKLRRAIRQYYKSGVMQKVKGEKGGYKFENLPYDPFRNTNVSTQTNFGLTSKFRDDVQTHDMETRSDILLEDEDNVREEFHSFHPELSNMTATERHFMDNFQSWTNKEDSKALWSNNFSDHNEGKVLKNSHTKEDDERLKSMNTELCDLKMSESDDMDLFESWIESEAIGGIVTSNDTIETCDRTVLFNFNSISEKHIWEVNIEHFL